MNIIDNCLKNNLDNIFYLLNSISSEEIRNKLLNLFKDYININNIDNHMYNKEYINKLLINSLYKEYKKKIDNLG